MNPKLSRILQIVTFIFILAFALFLRRHTFDLPHYRGDQHHYVALAFKLDTEGVSGYNLRGVDMFAHKKYPESLILAKAKDKGSVLKSLEADGITYYDEPLHHMPFGFPVAIMLSHKILAPSLPFFLIHSPYGNPGFRPNPAVKNTQIYAVIVPLISSLFFTLLTFFTARMLFKDNFIAFLSMFLMAISPTDILTSQKIWADDMTSMFTILAVFLYLAAREKSMSILAFLAGLSCGISAITKQSGFFIVFVITLWHFASNWRLLLKRETLLKTVFDKNLVLFLCGSFIVTLYWFLKVFSVYGSPIYMPRQEDLKATAKIDWYKVTTYRPSCIYAVCPPYQNPLFILAYIAPLWLWFDRKKAKEVLFLLAWVAVFLVIFQGYLKGGKEERYMLPAFPAFAILAAYVANKIIVGANNYSPLLRIFTIIVSAAVLIASVFWSVPMAYDALFRDGALIMKPF